MVEMAFVLFLLVVLIFGMTEFGRAMYIKNTLNNAARAGVRAAGLDELGGRYRARAQAGEILLASEAVEHAERDPGLDAHHAAERLDGKVERGETRFSPREFVITNVGRDFRPIDVIPLTPGFGEQRLRRLRHRVYSPHGRPAVGGKPWSERSALADGHDRGP